MTHTSAIENPFMLMLHPEIVISAMESSERLNQLNRHLCRPLDKPILGSAPANDEEDGIEDMSPQASLE